MKPRIRRAQSTDVEQLCPLVKDFVTSFDLDVERFRDAYQRLIVDHQAVVLVAESNGLVVGYCLGFVHETFFANGPVAWVEEIMVDTVSRRSGIGESLMAEFETWAKEKGAVLSALATRRAATFYRALGYEESAAYFRRML